MARVRFPTNLLRGAASFLDGWRQRSHIELRAELMLEAYRRRRERYRAAALDQGLRYDPAGVAASTTRRLQSKGIGVTPRAGSDVHTLAYVPMISWHHQLLSPLRELGPLSHFDYEAHGLRYTDLAFRRPGALDQRRAAALAFEEFARTVSRERKVDWVYVYATGMEIPAPTLGRVREITGAPIVGMCLDDKQSWEGPEYGGQRLGQIDIAPELDLAWTSARVACEWYLAEGSNPIFLPEGCSPDLFQPRSAPPDIDVSFTGIAYGFRPDFIARLRRAGLEVRTYGRGWPDGGLSDEEMVRVMQRSKLILGLGGIGWSEHLKNVKGRDFDAPCVGAYVTSFNPDLADWFRIGSEIACYSCADEAVDVLRWLLRDDNARQQLAQRGRSRCIATHTWQARFETVLEALGIRDASERCGTDEGET